MGVGAQNDLGGTKVLPENWLESCQTNQSFFCPKKSDLKKNKKKDLHSNWDSYSVQVKVLSKKKVFTQIETVFLSKWRCSPKKKRSSLKLRQFFCPDKGDLQEKVLSKKTKKKIFTQIETVFLS